MATHRVGRKKSNKKKAGHRKNPRRVAAGKKAWRSRVKRFGGKDAALEASFGHRGGKRGKKGKGGKKGGKGRKKGHHRSGGRGATFNAYLKEIKKRYGTENFPATANEIAMAEQAAYYDSFGSNASRRGVFAGNISPAERELQNFQERIKREKRQMASRLLSIEEKKRREEEHRKKLEDAARAVDKIASSL